MTFRDAIKRDIAHHEREIEKLKAYLDAEMPWLEQEAIPRNKEDKIISYIEGE